jgi:hypothetical protein
VSRAARITIGSVIAGALVFVALVAGVMSGTSTISRVLDPYGSDSWLAAGADTPASAEVLDFDDDGFGWTSLDVRWTTTDGEVVVTYVDWSHRDDVPAIGDQVEILYDPLDPEWAFAADDPFVGGVAADDETAEESAAAAEAAAAARAPVERAAGWVSLTALVGFVVTVVVTVVAAVRAPSPGREPRDGAVHLDPLAPHPWQGTPVPAGFAQPYPAAAPYPQSPYPPPPYPPAGTPPYPRQAPSPAARTGAGVEPFPGAPPAQWPRPS